jgi:hypothetical protein
MTMSPLKTGEQQSPPRRARARLIIGICLAVAVCALVPLRVLGIVYAFPLTGVILAWSTPAERGTAQVRLSIRTVVVLVFALACCVVVALLPYETVFFLKIFGGDFGLLVVALASVLAVALPLVLRESPTPDCP